MNRTVIGALSALALSGSLVAGVGASSAAAHDTGATGTGTNAAGVTSPQVNAVTYEGTVALSNCSGSIVKLPNSTDQDPALVLTNGHCLEGGMPGAGQVLVDQPSSRSFTLLNATAGNAGTVRATKLAYGTMTDTDAALYQVNATYAQIKQRYNVNALALSAERPTSGAGIKVVSGYWKRTYTCNANGFVNQLREGPYTWKDSVRYTSPCNVIGGTSGSPVIDTASGKVVAVNNTINESGQRCTMNNPCEVDQNGQVTVRRGIGYAQQTYQITRCVGAGNEVDLSLPGCTLPKPRAAHAGATGRPVTTATPGLIATK
ncbi:S1 family peptidase [Streptomyces buecherae]|uniref:Trypsin-like peptidase domain-containing protein n=1 Tax=Streptomyces buecherae TaxID=2763006 RepID=A0A7H8NC22_9ACTN|nr:serine protease [Streptomyces buecherae]QKW52050.1 trypsin-like peptidase domain-containing protein [Streptomyces buecherae]